MNKLYLHKNKMRLGQLPFIGVMFGLLFFSASVHGQSTNTISLDVPQVVPVSPTVAAMEKYQSYPVSHCTGIPDITVPLYEIVAGEVTIPVTLSYHSSGLKPKERSGVAGTGWTLNLEPSVSRHINGVADDKYREGWFYVAGAQVPWQSDQQMEFYEKRANNETDIRPKFVYKLPHGGGSGYFRTQHMPMWTVPRNNDLVKWNYDGTMNITDENGLRYYFGGTCEKTGDDITRWLCSSICSARHPEQQLVSFSYLSPVHFTNPSSYYNLNGQLIFKAIDQPNRETLLVDGTSCYRVCPPDDYQFSEEIKEARLESISRDEAGVGFSEPSHYAVGDIEAAFVSGVDFLDNHLSVSYKRVGRDGATYSTVLDEMKVKDRDGMLVRAIKFYITPYNDNTSLTKLDSVRISSPGVEDRVWVFDYGDVRRVPSIYTTSVDHWGFCNGPENSGQGKLPGIREVVSLDLSGFSDMHSFVVNYPGANRNPSPGYAGLGVLSRIIDPQGVQTRFSYEGNYGAFRDSRKDASHRDYLHPVGGLRVSSVESYDPHTNRRIRKSYQYGLTIPNVPNYEPVWGGGAIRHIVTQRDYQSDGIAIYRDPATDADWKEELTIYGSMPVSNITLHDGSAVMYNVVSEKTWGDDGTQTTTMYYYDVERHAFEDLLVWDDSDPSGSVKQFVDESITEETEALVRRKPYYSHEPSGDFIYGKSNRLYGALLRTEYYRGSELVSVVENSYSAKKIESQQIQILVPERHIVTGWKEFEESVYYGDYSVFTTHYENLDIDTYRQLDKEVTKRYYTSEGKRHVFTTEKRFAYDYDFFDPGFSLKPRRVETMRSDSTTVVDTYDYLLNYPAILSYHKHMEGDNNRESRILFNTGTCLPQKVQSRTDKQANFRDEVVYRRYDASGNAVEIAGKDGTPVSFLWSYNNCFPIARIENATIDEVCAALEIESADEWTYDSVPGSDVRVRIGSLREKLPDARVTTYEYVSLHGVTAITDPNGVTTRFDYDNYSRLTGSYYLDANARKVMLQKYVYHFGK